MTNEELIAKIKEEIERQLKEGEEKINLGKSNPYWDPAVMSTLSNFQSFLFDLEKSLPAKVADGEGLEEEIERYLPKIPENPYNEELRVFARYFYDLGCRRTAEKYDEIEYNRQRASGSSEIPNDLEEAARYYLLNEHSSPLNAVFHQADPKSEMVYHKDIENAFIAGAKWQKQHDAELIEIAYNDGITIGMTKQKEQMMKDAVEGEVIVPIYEGNDIWSAEVKIPGRYEVGDKVRVIILPKED